MKKKLINSYIINVEFFQRLRIENVEPCVYNTYNFATTNSNSRLALQYFPHARVISLVVAHYTRRALTHPRTLARGRSREERVRRAYIAHEYVCVYAAILPLFTDMPKCPGVRSHHESFQKNQ